MYIERESHQTLVLLTKFYTCVLGNLAYFFVVWIFFQNYFIKNAFRNIIRVSNSLDPDQAQHFVGSDLGPNCLQRLSAEDIKQVKTALHVINLTDYWFPAIL